MKQFDPFVLPFLAGTVFLLVYLVVTYIRWFIQIPRVDKRKVWVNLFTVKTLKSIWECITECLLHRRIFKVNPRLGYMHASLAFGWFMLIVIGKAESSFFAGTFWEPFYLPIFFKYFVPSHAPFFFDQGFSFLMDLTLLFVLSGLFLAILKRFNSKALHVNRPTKHTKFDQRALAALWCIFPLRLLAESFNSGLYHNGNFLTGSLGKLFAFIPENVLSVLNYGTWWAYSIALCLFFCFLPFSRYMHIFTEIFLIFLRNWGIEISKKGKGFSTFELYACSRCGICIDVCQLNTAANITNVQPVYFLRDERHKTLAQSLANNCLLCGRCETVCPVQIKSTQHRLNSRIPTIKLNETEFSYLPQKEEIKKGDIAYFAGCMTHLTPSLEHAMIKILNASGRSFTYIDEDKTACCGRPMMLSGAKDAARKLIQHNQKLIARSGAKVLVTSCPICYKVFKETYNLDIPVIHHTQFINKLINDGTLKLQHSDARIVYHDPCELGRGSHIYDEPRSILQQVGNLLDIPEDRDHALCCGGSLADTEINYKDRGNIARNALEILCKDNPDYLATACPLCKKTFHKERKVVVKDIAEIVADQL
ncbi:MAG: (Fe-S)-binding protein [Bacteroidales bacterium]|nr:(Fe-S)-binding protein [Bacteroidales bacterium]